MKVLIFGLPRTGTTSIGKALSILGYNVHKGLGENFGANNYLPLFTEALQAKYQGVGRRYTKEDYDNFIGCYDAAHGLGIALLAEDLIEAYPDAKFILTPRDVDGWIESWNTSILAMHKWWEAWNWLLPICGGPERDFRAFREVAFPQLSCGDTYSRVGQRKAYLDHNQRIRDAVPSSQLLECLPQEGWEPLCQFLGQKVPSGVPFPHAQSRKLVKQEMNWLWKRAVKRTLFRIAMALGAGGLGLVLLLRYKHARFGKIRMRK